MKVRRDPLRATDIEPLPLGGLTREVSRFVLNGVGATLIHYAVFYLLYFAIALPSAAVSNGIWAVFGILASFTGSRCFVFSHRRGDWRREFRKFLALYIIMAILQVLMLFVWTDLGGFDANVGFGLAIIIQATLSFLGNRFFVFPGARGQVEQPMPQPEDGAPHDGLT